MRPQAGCSYFFFFRPAANVLAAFVSFFSRVRGFCSALPAALSCFFDGFLDATTNLLVPRSSVSTVPVAFSQRIALFVVRHSVDRSPLSCFPQCFALTATRWSADLLVAARSERRHKLA
jgi:hypothetical protein